MINELKDALVQSKFQKGPDWWHTAPKDIGELEALVNIGPGMSQKLAADAAIRAKENGTSPEIEFFIGFAKESSEMFKIIQRESLKRIAAHLYTEEEEEHNKVITTVKTD
jgi:hypothetical protein